MPCQCATRWTQQEKKGSARITLGTTTYDVPMPTYVPTPNPPINIGGGSWSFKANNPGGSSPTVTLASNVLFSSQPAPDMASGPFAVEGPCEGGGGATCDCINTNNGKGTLVLTTPKPNEKVNDSNLNDFTKDGKWVWTWASGAQQPVNGPATTRRRKAKVKHEIIVNNQKYCFAHTCPGGGSSNTGSFGSTSTWLANMIQAGNTIIYQASN